MARYQVDDEDRDVPRWMVLTAVAAGLAILLGSALVAKARITDENRAWIAQLTPADRDYLRNQYRVYPGGGSINCCSEADGEETEQDTRSDPEGTDHYWVRSAHTDGEWIKVPDDAVLTTPNLHGRTVVWWTYVGAPGKSESIRCMAPGGGA